MVIGATAYNVYRDGAKVGSSKSNSYDDTGLTASTTYTYEVTAVNADGESAKSASIDVTTTA